MRSKLAFSRDDEDDDENIEKDDGELESDDDDDDEPTLMSRSKHFAKQVNKCEFFVGKGGIIFTQMGTSPC